MAHSDGFFIEPGFVFHKDIADETTTQHGARRDSSGVDDQYVTWISIGRKRMWNKPVIAGASDLLPNLSPFTSRLCSSFAPDRSVLRTQLV